MDKHLNRYQMLFSLGLIFMLALAVGAFFAGVEVGSARTETRYEAKSLQAAAAKTAVAYTQQDLVSFYHTVFSPYREFQSEWLKMESRLEARSSAPSVGQLEQLGELASKKRKEIEAVALEAKGSLLTEARADYLRSLDRFVDAASHQKSAAAGSTPERFLTALRADKDYKQATADSLSGQNRYYSAMLAWASSTRSAIPRQAELAGVVSLDKWSSSPLAVKNKLVADLLSKRGRMRDFLPQDLAGAVDQLIESGEADKLGLTSFQDAVELLSGTGAVRSGDFWQIKSRLYGSEVLPQLPFFLPPES
ncbi:hypothetical protein NYE40_10670 [Paenibacillus sp. FSL W8-1187]|uniref:Uncharacterized protein n=1 Tax=Paenibacillus pasadenensis TaxID=217090 RepID=A0A2N5N5N2_9BACL|nr:MULTISPECIES: hypothetical protein [Paenibacillus]PLT45613.1 hypothetical protein B8V81_4044 [Paenibacillus pasadenensis]QGG56065.1 hypothetical protein GE073_11095 [Paenibacillus sp. B01]